MSAVNEKDCPCIPAALRDRDPKLEVEVFPADPCNGTGHTRLAWRSRNTTTCSYGTIHTVYEIAVLPCPACDPEEYRRVSDAIAEHV